jgi:hypothetical protein
VLLEIGTDIGRRIPDPPAPMPAVRQAHGGVAILTRCEDDGKVQLEVWSGDPDRPRLTGTWSSMAVW